MHEAGRHRILGTARLCRWQSRRTRKPAFAAPAMRSTLRTYSPSAVTLLTDQLDSSPPRISTVRTVDDSKRLCCQLSCLRSTQHQDKPHERMVQRQAHALSGQVSAAPLISLRYSTLTESGTCPASHSPRGRMSITGVPCFCAATTSWGAKNLTCENQHY